MHSPDDPAGLKFCRWLMPNTSTEFMEANINRALSCLQGQQIRGYVGNTGIESWSGKARFFAPRIDAESVSVEIEYLVAPDTEDSEDFLRISVIPDE